MQKQAEQPQSNPSLPKFKPQNEDVPKGRIQEVVIEMKM
jgi:hypothetical protein